MLPPLTVLCVVAALAGAAPAAARAGWSPPHPAREGAPGAEVAVLAAGEGEPLRVRVRGGDPIAVPGSEGARGGVAAVGPRGVVVVAWAVLTCEAAERAGDVRTCGRVLATRWQSGQNPPAPTRLSRDDGRYATAPAAGVAADGTVVVAWNVETEDLELEPLRVDAALARGDGGFSTVEVAHGRGIEALEGVARVGDAAQIALSRSVRGKLRVLTVDAAGGRLRRPHTEAAVPDTYALDLRFLRSRRGDRLLAWEGEKLDRVFVRRGAPGRPLGRRMA
ncbi:MAG TPA: hypothetical protein VF533_14895, partial [Solirubrobacteraceae bacterium]